MTIEHGQLFKGEMVRAILSDQKTLTRRLPTQHNSLVDGLGMGPTAWKAMGLDFSRATIPEGQAAILVPSAHFGTVHRLTPRVQAGDSLWVRENYMPDPPRDGTWPSTAYDGCKPHDISLIPKHYRNPHNCLYEATWDGIPLCGWTPSIHMPRWACRLVLPVVGVRAERLQDISEVDAIAEGCTQNHNGYFWGGPHSVIGRKQMATAKSAYRDLWQSINGDGSWEENPCVWIYDFRRGA